MHMLVHLHKYLLPSFMNYLSRFFSDNMSVLTCRKHIFLVFAEIPFNWTMNNLLNIVLVLEPYFQQMFPVEYPQMKPLLTWISQLLRFLKCWKENVGVIKLRAKWASLFFYLKYLSYGFCWLYGYFGKCCLFCNLTNSIFFLQISDVHFLGFWCNREIMIRLVGTT